MEQYTQPECKALWESIKGNRPTIEEIDNIDSKTPWSNIEPKWWLAMMEVRRQLQKDKQQ